MGQEWWEGPAALLNAADLIEWLHERFEDGPLDAPSIVAILRKPWHWTAEYALMRAGEARTEPSPAPEAT